MRETAAGGAALDIEGRACAWLANCAGWSFAAFTKTLNQADGRGRFTFAERRRRNGGNIDIFGRRGVFKPVEHLCKIDFAQGMACGKNLVFLQSYFFGQLENGFDIFLSRFGYFPVFHFRRVKFH